MRRLPTAPTVAGSCDAQIYPYSAADSASMAGRTAGRIRVEFRLMSKRYAATLRADFGYLS